MVQPPPPTSADHTPGQRGILTSYCPRGLQSPIPRNLKLCRRNPYFTIDITLNIFAPIVSQRKSFELTKKMRTIYELRTLIISWKPLCYFNLIFWRKSQKRRRSRRNRNIYFVRYTSLWVLKMCVMSSRTWRCHHFYDRTTDNYVFIAYAYSWKTGETGKYRLYLLNTEGFWILRNSILNTIVELSSIRPYTTM